MKMIRDQCPSETGGRGIEQDITEPIQKVISIFVVPENLFPFDPTTNEVVQGTWRVNARLPWHEE
jgi:hypothetical protein